MRSDRGSSEYEGLTGRQAKALLIYNIFLSGLATTALVILGHTFVDNVSRDHDFINSSMEAISTPVDYNDRATIYERDSDTGEIQTYSNDANQHP